MFSQVEFALAGCREIVKRINISVEMSRVLGVRFKNLLIPHIIYLFIVP